MDTVESRYTFSHSCTCMYVASFWPYVISYMSLHLKVYIRLQRLLQSLSHQRTLTYLDKLGENFDAEIRQWKRNIEVTLLTAGVCDATLLTVIATPIFSLYHPLLQDSNVCADTQDLCACPTLPAVATDHV